LYGKVSQYPGDCEFSHSSLALATSPSGRHHCAAEQLISPEEKAVQVLRHHGYSLASHIQAWHACLKLALLNASILEQTSVPFFLSIYFRFHSLVHQTR